MQDFENKDSSATKQSGTEQKRDNDQAQSSSKDLQASNQGTGNKGTNGKDSSQSTPILAKVKDTASDAYSTVADGASGLIDEKKGELTSGLTGIAQTVRRVSEAITGGEGTAEGLTGSASNYVESAAAKLEGVADYFDSRDLRAMAGDVQAYARRNPAIFLGTAFAIGVLAARFIKSRPLDTRAQGVSSGGSGNGQQQKRSRSASASGASAA